jgi:hypothetical protein
VATTLFLLSAVATNYSGAEDLGAQGNGAHTTFALGTARGAGLTNATTNTLTGPTTGIEVQVSASRAVWISEPVSADVTISGTITANIWASENNMSANVAINVYLYILRADGSKQLIVQSTRTTELAVTTNAVNNFTTGMTSGAYTGQTLNRGDRLCVIVFGDDAGVMATGFTFQLGYNGATGAADGDTFITLTENLTFETLTTPAGSQVFLTDTASDVVTASVDREAWTSRGGGVVNDVTNTAAGWVTPGVHMTDTAGGTVVDWFTKPLAAFTLGGVARANTRALESSTAANCGLRVEIARVDGDGTNPTVWASACLSPAASSSGELSTTEVAREAWVTGDDLAVSEGQRLRIRVYLEDITISPLVTGHTATFFYNGTSAAASGDSYVTFPQTLTESSPATPQALRTQARYGF